MSSVIDSLPILALPKFRRARSSASLPSPTGTSDARPVPVWPGLATAAAVGLIYLLVASGGTLFPPQSAYPHHVLIADAWLHGQLNVRPEVLRDLAEPFYQSIRSQIEAAAGAQGRSLTEAQWQELLPRLPHAPGIHDWLYVDGKFYGYWGPLPALLLLPYVAMTGLNASDRLFDSLIGAGTVLFTYLMLREAARRHLLALTPICACALAILMGLGTVHFYLSVLGGVWFFSQITATFFLTVAIWAMLRTDRGIRWVALGGAAFGAVLLSRISILATAPFFLVALVAGHDSMGPARWSQTARRTLVFTLPVLFCLAILLLYNYARFGNPFEDGVAIQTATGANLRFKAAYDQHGVFSLHYVPHNVYYYFLNPALLRDPTTQALTFDPEGNSMFLVTPALLFAFRSFRQRNWLTIAAAAGAVLCLAMLLTFFGTGWYNFGNRYLLDLMPLLILLIAAGMGGRLTFGSLFLIGLSLLVNAWGTYRFTLQQP